MTDLCKVLGTTPQRRVLLRNLITYRGLLASDGYINGFQFIDGSFVENVEIIGPREPSDIDVFSLLHAPQKYHADAALWASVGLQFWVGEIIDMPKNKARFKLDTYALLFEEMTPSSLIRNIIYWYSLFSHQRDTFLWKGFVALPLNDADDQAALLAMGSS